MSKKAALHKILEQIWSHTQKTWTSNRLPLICTTAMLLSCISRAALLPRSEVEIPTHQTQPVHSSVIPLEVTASEGDPWTGATVPHRGQGEWCSTEKLTPWSFFCHSRLCPWRERGTARHNLLWVLPHTSHDPPHLACGTCQSLPLWLASDSDVRNPHALGQHVKSYKINYKKYYSSVRHSSLFSETYGLCKTHWNKSH